MKFNLTNLFIMKSEKSMRNEKQNSDSASGQRSELRKKLQIIGKHGS